MNDLEVLRQMVTVKFFCVICLVKWLNGEHTKSRADTQSHPSLHWLVGNNKHRAWTGIYTTDWIPSHIKTLRMRTEMVLKTLVCSLFNYSTQQVKYKVQV
jgi:hypothetical protein